MEFLMRCRDMEERSEYGIYIVEYRMVRSGRKN